MGRVKSLKRKGVRDDRLLTLLKDRDGYYQVTLKNKGNLKKAIVHRLVASAFIYNPDPLNKIQVNHKDKNRNNNNISNLEWVTPKENIHHKNNVDNENILIFDKSILKYTELKGVKIMYLTYNQYLSLL